MRVRLSILALGACLFVPSLVRADAVGVSYSVSGSSGAWVLDFSVTNNVQAGQDVYFFGVFLPAQDIVSSPSGYENCLNSCTETTFNPSFDGGPDISYNNLFHIHMSTNVVTFGETLSGFEVGVNTAAPPTSVDWFAYALDDTAGGTAPYLGTDNFNFGVTVAGFDASDENPGFAGTATASTPEPGSLILLGAGLIGLAPILRRRVARLS